MWLAKLRSNLITMPLIALATSVMSTLSLLVSLWDSSGRSQHRVARAWSRMLLRIAGVKVTVEGLERITPGGSYVFIANHSSYFDVPVILPWIPVQFRFLANRNLFGVPFIGYHLRRAGHLPVDSASARESLRTMSEAARIVQQRGISILLFPEGGRSEGELLPFKDGAAYIATRAGVPIVPIALSGTRGILPLHSATVRPGRVRMRIGYPVETLDLGLQDRTRLTNALRETMAELLEEAPAAARG